MRTIAQRVDALLQHGVEGIKKWATKHTYVEPKIADDACWDHEKWLKEWQTLRNHHLEETEFFLKVIDELRTRLLKASDDSTSRTDD
jgi:hypothetical protein